MNRTTLPLHHRGAAHLAGAIARGETTSRALTEMFLDRIHRLNPTLNAVVVLRGEDALARAAEADRDRERGLSWGPLHGVPITIKECFDWIGTPSTYGLPERRGHCASADAVAVARLKRAGAIVMGKTNVPRDLADWQSFNPVYGGTKNPWDHGRSPGGSSGGSASALAAGLSALELGSDIGGSIRIPAHFCGVYGHKPTFGIVPFGGHSMAEHTAPDDLSVVGPLARRAEDLALALRLIAGPDGAQARGWRLALPKSKRMSLRGARIAIKTGDETFPVDGEVTGTTRIVADALRGAGATVTYDPPLPISSRESYELYIGLLRGATSGRRSPNDLAQLAQKPAALDVASGSYESLMLRGLTQSHRTWLGYVNQRERLRAGWEVFFTSYDALIAPISPSWAFPEVRDTPKEAQQLLVDGVLRPNADTYFWLGIPTAAYLPATTFPAGRSNSGMPIGLQIIGPEFGDYTCIALAERLAAIHRGFEPPPEPQS